VFLGEKKRKNGGERGRWSAPFWEVREREFSEGRCLHEKPSNLASWERREKVLGKWRKEKEKEIKEKLKM